VLTRRRFLGGAVVLVCELPALGLLGGCGGQGPRAAGPDGEADLPPGLDGGADPGADTPPAAWVDGWEVPPGATLAPGRYAALAALFDALIPGDPASPGATETGAAWYLDQLLGAFRTDPPRIFAGGPYSGRHGGLDGFSRFLPLTRVEEIRWRTFIEGSQGLPEREFNGPVTGLVERYEAGLAALDLAAQDAGGERFALLDTAARRQLLPGLDPGLLKLAYEHAVEGTFGDPVYGGNRDGRGWAAIDYEGDRQPRGFSARQLLHPEEG